LWVFYPIVGILISSSVFPISTIVLFGVLSHGTFYNLSIFLIGLFMLLCSVHCFFQQSVTALAIVHVMEYNKLLNCGRIDFAKGNLSLGGWNRSEKYVWRGNMFKNVDSQHAAWLYSADYELRCCSFVGVVLFILLVIGLILIFWGDNLWVILTFCRWHSVLQVT